MTASEEVAEFLLENVPDKKDELIAKLQRQKFLLEGYCEQYKAQVKKLRNGLVTGEDNPVLRTQIKELQRQVTALEEKERRVRVQNGNLKQTADAAEQKLVARNIDNERLIIEIAELKVKLGEKKPKKLAEHLNGKTTATFKEKPAPEGYIEVVCDGGTKSNTPPYGIGYGSFKIGSDEPIRLNFSQRMSANVAELKTVMAALKHIQEKTHGDYKVYLTGDSQIALNWVEDSYGPRSRSISLKSSELFRQAVAELRTLVSSNLRMTDLRVEWKPRRYSVAALGH